MYLPLVRHIYVDVIKENFMSIEECELEIMELQAKVAFQEDMLQSLNDIVTKQDKAIRALSGKVKRWESRLDDMAYSMDSDSNKASEPPPPHY